VGGAGSGDVEGQGGGGRIDNWIKGRINLKKFVH